MMPRRLVFARPFPLARVPPRPWRLRRPWKHATSPLYCRLSCLPGTFRGSIGCHLVCRPSTTLLDVVRPSSASAAPLPPSGKRGDLVLRVLTSLCHDTVHWGRTVLLWGPRCQKLPPTPSWACSSSQSFRGTRNPRLAEEEVPGEDRIQHEHERHHFGQSETCITTPWPSTCRPKGSKIFFHTATG